MVKPKRKSEKQAPPKKSSSQSPSAVTPQKAPTLDELNWREEIELLLADKPTSVEQGVSLLIERVLNRLGLVGDEREQTGAFLVDVFADDMELLDQIKAALKIEDRS